MHAPGEEKNDDSKDSFYKQLEQVFFNNFPKHHMKILLRKFDAKLGIENIFRLTTGNKSLDGDNSGNSVQWWTSPRLVVYGTIFLH